MRRTEVTHEFVHFVPEKLDDGVVYVSIPFATAVHLCCCGCGTEVATPFSPADWQLTFDGRSVSLSPSIGNWSLPCRSHYWIRDNKIIWAQRWSNTEIADARAHDRTESHLLFGKSERQPQKGTPPRSAGGIRIRVRRFLSRFLRGV